MPEEVLGSVEGAEQEDDQQAKQLDQFAVQAFWSPSPSGTSARHGDQGETSAGPEFSQTWSETGKQGLST